MEEVKLMPYIGAKVVKAKPMDHATFLSEIKGKAIDHENSDGYMVVYDDGYTSWSPKEVFERCYRKVTPSEALLALDAEPEASVGGEEPPAGAEAPAEPPASGEAGEPEPKPEEGQKADGGPVDEPPAGVSPGE